jgi:branched-chain amino acid transport system ATP-binding protein
MTDMPILEVAGVHTYYGASHVLHGVDFSVRRGETVSLMGRNGMGKTTTIRSIFGLTPPRRGEIEIDGRAVTGQKPHRIARAGLALVPEGRGIFPNLSVEENLVMAARSGAPGRGDWTLQRAYKTFPALAERRRNMGDQLSGGEQQMLAIGRALMTNPGLLVLDEATEGLAPLVRKEIWRVLRQVKDTGIATLIVDKDVNALLAVCDRCLILAKGEVVYAGTAAELAQAPDIHIRHLGV